ATPGLLAAAAEDPAQQVLEVQVSRAEVLGAEVAAAEPEPARSAAALGSTRSSPGASPAGSGAGPPPGLRIHVLGHLAEIRPEGVVAAPGLRIREDVVGLGNVLEPVLGPGGLVDIRVIRASQPAVGPLDVFLAGVPGHAQNVVEVPAGRGHQSDLATR